MSELEKLRKIKQPKNKKAIFFLQASDNERKSISSLCQNIFSFSGLAVKWHPNSSLSVEKLFLNLKKSLGEES